MTTAHILVVDDEPDIRGLLKEILEDEGFVVRLAENAATARELRAKHNPSLVLLDIWMPDTDGISLLKERAANGQLTMPVVMMSGHGTIETAVEATKVGALDYLEKPIALQRLLATVKRALSIGPTMPRILSGHAAAVDLANATDGLGALKTLIDTIQAQAAIPGPKGDVPVVGALFRNTTKVASKTELLIFITPKVVSDRQVAR